QLLDDAGRVQQLLPDAPDQATMYALAQPWLQLGGYGHTALAALQKDRTAPPRLGALTEGLAQSVPGRVPTQPPPVAEPPRIDTSVHPAEFIAVLTTPVQLEQARVRTTVARPGQVAAMRPPTLAQVRALQDPAVAPELRLGGPTAGARKRTWTAGTTVPLTRGARAGTAAVAGRGAPADARARLAALNTGLFEKPAPKTRGTKKRPSRPAAADGAALLPGEIAVLRMPNATHDVGAARSRPRLNVSGGAARAIVLGAGGHVLMDGAPVRNTVTLEEGAERIAVLALGDGDPAAGGLSGWHA